MTLLSRQAASKYLPLGVMLKLRGWMPVLITYLCQGPIFGIHGKDGDAVFFQTVAGVEVFPIRTEVDVCTSTGGYGVGCDSLYLFQAAVVVTEGNDLTGQFGDEIGKLPVRLNVRWRGPESASMPTASREA